MRGFRQAETTAPSRLLWVRAGSLCGGAGFSLLRQQDGVAGKLMLCIGREQRRSSAATSTTTTTTATAGRTSREEGRGGGQRRSAWCVVLVPSIITVTHFSSS